MVMKLFFDFLCCSLCRGGVCVVWARRQAVLLTSADDSKVLDVTKMTKAIGDRCDENDKSKVIDVTKVTKAR